MESQAFLLIASEIVRRFDAYLKRSFRDILFLHLSPRHMNSCDLAVRLRRTGYSQIHFPFKMTVLVAERRIIKIASVRLGFDSDILSIETIFNGQFVLQWREPGCCNYEQA
jgi:hypothetical protein